MRSVSNLIATSEKPQLNGALVLVSFVLFAITVMALPIAMVWAASN